MKPIEKVLNAIGHDNARQQGNGWQALCPAHPDKKASLTITEDETGKALLFCHAGCETETILLALNLKMGDLFSNNSNNQKPQIVATYDYTDETGKVLFQTLRYSPKDFRQRHTDSTNKMVWNLKGVRRVLYRLPKVLKAIETGETVFFVEGEKDVATMEKMGFTATTNPMGANKWDDSYTQTLTGASVVIIPDNDESGKKHVQAVYSRLKATAKSVEILTIPTPGIDKGDVTDWMNAGGTREKLLELLKSPPKDPVLELLEDAKELYGKGDMKGLDRALFNLSLSLEPDKQREPFSEHLKKQYEIVSNRNPGELLGANLDMFKGICDHISGLQPGHYHLGAETNIGKTAFCINLMLDYLDSNETPKGIFFSLDDSKRVIINRIVAYYTGLSINAVQHRQTDKNTQATIKEVYDTLIDLAESEQFQIYDLSDLQTVAELETIVKNNMDTTPFVIIDGLYNLSVGDSFRDNRLENIERANRIKALVDTYEIPLLTTGELRKKSTTDRGNKRTLEDLHETQKFGYNANLVWLLYLDQDQDPKQRPPFEPLRLCLDFAKNKLSDFKGIQYLDFWRFKGVINEYTPDRKNEVDF